MSEAALLTDLKAQPPADRRLRLALRLAGMIKFGTLTVVMPDGSSHRVVASETPVGTIVLKHPRAVRRLVLGGSLGLADAYVEGLWDSPDIRAVLAVAAANEAAWSGMLNGKPMLRGLARLLQVLRPNDRDAAGDGVIAQYDLGTGFYAAWLDPTMSFSSAWFAGTTPGPRVADLEAGQLRKIHRMCRLLQLAPGMRLLEIGCGWGGFAEVAARDYGVSVVGTTLSPFQLDHARQRIAAAGLSHRVELRLQDYRDVTGSFDRVASIEAFEAVGEAHWPAFFAVLRERLRKTGLAGLQLVTVSDQLFDEYRTGREFVRHHIVPGGMLASKRRLRQAIVRAGMAWGEEYWFARDYADTLALWQEQFQAAWPRILADTSLNRRPCDVRFKRLWEYFLAYRETGFRSGWTDVGQVLIARNG